MRITAPGLLLLFPFVLFRADVLAGPSPAAPPPEADDDLAPILRAIRGISLSGQWFLNYHAGEEGEESFNEFALRRGYITIKKKFSGAFSGRITQDISVDKEGDGRGDVEVRLRYCYVRYDLPEAALFAAPHVEFGLAHRPWLDFEQHVNPYRVQGTLFLERIGVVSSADYGVTFATYFGGEMDVEYRGRVSGAYPGRYGSASFGVYNGGGYHAIEENENKTVEGRLTLRPWPDRVPGLQLSAHGAVGEGNVAAGPDWDYAAGFVSFEHERVIATAMLLRGTGNYTGTLVDASGKALDLDGYSLFADVRPTPAPVHLFGRYEETERGSGEDAGKTKRTIAGVAYHFMNGNKLLVDYDHLDGSGADEADEAVAEFAVEVIY